MEQYEHYSLFGESWWLDAVTGPGGWEEVRIESGGRLQARLPFVTRKKYSCSILTSPPLTQCLGPWISGTYAKYSTQLARQKDLTGEIISRFPKHDGFSQNFHHQMTNWLPWFWNGYTQTTRYTYVLGDLRQKDILWKGLQSNIRSDIRKARDRFGLVIVDDLGPAVLFDLCQKTFERINRKGLSEKTVFKIYETCERRDAGRAFFAVDPKKRVHAALYLVWDNRAAYYLLGGGHPKLRNSGAHSLLMWEAIVYASTVSKKFDFEGSMIESVERFFRAFGARQIPYHQITKINNRWMKAGWLMKDAVKTLVKGNG